MTEPVESSRTGLNLALLVALVLCVASVVVLGMQMNGVHRDDSGDRSGSWWETAVAVVTDQRVPGGTATVPGVRTAPMDQAPQDVQERNGAILDAAGKMATAFVNLRYDDAEAAVEAVKSQATGSFKRQYTKSAAGLVKIAKRAKSVMTGEVLWTGLVAADDDSGTAIAATTGTVTNKTTDFKPQARNYRLQIELVLTDGRWLVRDVQFVA